MQLLGRSQELNAVSVAALRRLDSADPGVILVEGAAGVGKSSFLAEAAAQLRSTRSEVRVGYARATPAGGAVPYRPFVDILLALTGDDTDRGRNVVALARELAPDWLAVVPLVGGVLSASMVTAARVRRRTRGVLEASADTLFSQYLQLLCGLAQRAPFTLCIDDLHHADPGTCALLAHLCRRAGSTPLVVLGTTLAEPLTATAPVNTVARELERERRLDRVQLHELLPADAHSLLERELGAPASDELAHWALEHGGGIPRFVQEVARVVRTSDGAALVDGAWALRAGAEPLALPRPIQVALEREIAPLDDGCLLLLEHASVQGVHFDAALVAASLGLDLLSALDRIAEIEQRHRLVRPLPPADGEGMFAFRNTAVREAALARIRPHRRQLIEARLGELRARREPPDGSIVTRAVPVARAAADDVDRRPQQPVAHFVGREAELGQMQGALDSALREKRGCCLLVEGSPGAGKSTFVAELLQRVHINHSEMAIARGRCLQSFDSGDPYLPFIEALHDLADETDAGSLTQDTVGAILSDVAPYWLNAVPVVGGILSASYTTAARLQADERPEVASRELLHAQYLDLIRAIAERAPVLLVLDDLHWADHASAELLARLVENIEAMPVIVIGALRPVDDDVADQPAAKVLRTIRSDPVTRVWTLGELEGPALDRLIRDQFGADVSAPLHRWVVQAAGGNPLFAGELCRLLQESGAAVRVRGEWELTPAVSQLGMPRTAEAVIEARIARLDPQAVRVLQYASVEGNQFGTSLLRRLVEMDEQMLLTLLARLEREHRLVEHGGQVDLPNGERSTTVRFHHALIHGVLYAQVTGSRRTLLHRRAGSIIEDLFAGEPEPVAGKLARHFHEGGLPGPAYRYARLAADSARRIYAHWDAEELLRIARTHAPDAVSAAEIDESLGDVYDVVGYYPRGIDHYQLATDGAPPPAQPRLQRKLLFLQWKSAAAPPTQIVERIRQLLARPDLAATERCHLLLELGRFRGESDASQAVARAVDLAEQLDDPALLAQALEQHAVALVFGGNPADALSLLDRALATAGAADPRRAALNRNISGVALAKLGRYREALAAFTEMLAVAERLGHQNGIATAHTNIGHMLLRLGEFDAAEDALQIAVRIHERRDRTWLAQSRFNLAERARRAGDHALALARYEEMFTEMRELDNETSLIIALGGRGLCLLALGRPLQARECLDQANHLLQAHPDWFEDRELVDLLAARLDALEGDIDAATTRLHAAAARVGASDRFVWGQIEIERARLMTAMNPTRARNILADVLAHRLGESALDIDIRALEADLDLIGRGVTMSSGLRHES